MTIRIFVVIAALVLIHPAAAQRLTNMAEAAYELSLSDVRFPTNSIGALGLTSCTTCAQPALRIVPGSEFYVDGRIVEYGDLIDSVNNYRALDGVSYRVGVYVFFDTATESVNRLMLRAVRLQ